MHDDESIFRVIFTQQGKIYEVYANYISEEGLMGFIEIDELIFAEDTMVVDPAEERVKTEFKGVKRFYVPMHAIARIDEVSKKGTAKIKDISSKSKKENNISHFPGSHHSSPKDKGHA